MKLYHYSEKRLKVVDPKYQGNGCMGRESKEFDSTGKLLTGYLLKSNWYIDNKGFEEWLFGNCIQHITEVDSTKLYNLNTLPREHLWDRDVYIQSMGYVGWYVDNAQYSQARLFIPITIN